MYWLKWYSCKDVAGVLCTVKLMNVCITDDNVNVKVSTESEVDFSGD